MRIILAQVGCDRTVAFAADELARCLGLIDRYADIDRRLYDAVDTSLDGIIWVGLDGSVEASEDDEIKIAVKNGEGIITGSNKRAVLLAVYRFLYELGCRFIRPGDDGELIPEKPIDAELLNVCVSEKASYRHRAICIEGAVNYEHVYNVISWLPKVGMNGYFVQFQTPSCFFNRWYRHTGNPLVAEGFIDDAAVSHIWKRLEDEILKRGLMYHAIGHGWTCEPFGISGSSWDKNNDVIAPEVVECLAEVNGKRELWGGVPLNTNLCYSNKKVRETVTDAITEYCLKNPAVDYLHFWLADGSNNQCECAECQKLRPSDFYVMMLNELDKKLTAAGVKAKVVFLIYVDLLWEPEVYKIENPDRFVLMFAPITRTYYKEFADFDRNEKVELSPYVRNKLKMPHSVAENITRLSKWQAQFGGDSFDFDYHLMWHHERDLGYYQVSRLLHNDMANLDSIGINGMVSCQVQRASFPIGLPMYGMAKALWNKNSVFEDVSDEYFTASFGCDAKVVENYLRSLSELALPVPAETAAERYEQAKQLVRRFEADHISKKANLSASWKYLKYHAEMTLALLDIFTDPQTTPAAEHNAMIDKFKELVFSYENETHTVLDSWNYTNTVLRGQIR